MEKQFCFDYEHYAALSELSEADRRLVAEAERATANAHAPYSNFHVGAAASAQRENTLRQQLRKRGLSRGTLRRAVADVLRPGQLCRRSD